MIKLQKPAFAYLGGRVVPWEEANIHIASEALIRGISVFEGIKGYWREDLSSLQLLALEAHFFRLCRSARLQHLPFSMSLSEFREACGDLARCLMVLDRDLWLRPTIYSVEGHWGEGTVADLAITCYHQEKRAPGRLKVGITGWQKPGDSVLPARIKSAANYQMARIVRIEGRERGFDDMLLLNSNGRIAEATGSALIMVRNGRVVTPPAYEGCLESITVDIVERLCKSLDLPFERRPIDRSELLVADEVALCGTLMELGIVEQVDAYRLPDSSPVIDAIAERFWACARGLVEDPAMDLTDIGGCVHREAVQT